jgi:uncharacterized glyoxalase superfamily protein PhnB
MPAAPIPRHLFPRLIVRSLGGSPVLFQLELEDGKSEGRIRDPFGHVWILSQQVAG